MPSARITTPFGAQSTAMEVVAGVHLSGKRAIVTGASSGLGIETVRALASAGAEVTLAVREYERGEQVAREISASTSNQHLPVGLLDLADQASVDAFIAAWSGPLDILVNNAGVMATPEQRTREGWELQFATNHLGHFHLTTGLHDALAAAGRARVVIVSSVGHINGGVVFDDINFEHRAYDPWAAYAQSKTANILFMVEASRLWASDHIAVNALNPGRIPGTGLARYIESADAPASFDPHSSDVSWKNPEQGAATSVLLAASPLVDSVSGRYFEDCNEAEPHQPGIRRGVAAYALDPESAARLWRVSVDMLAARRQG